MRKTHAKIEEHLFLDSRIMAQLGIFRCDNIGTWEWHDISSKEMQSGISYLYEHDYEVLTLGYTLGSEKFKYDVDIVKKACNFGGLRFWFRCSFCRQCVGKLYFKPCMFLCRKCHNLNYNSQQSSKNTQFKDEKKIKKSIHQSTYVNTDPHIKFDGGHYLTFMDLRFLPEQTLKCIEANLDVDKTLELLLEEIVRIHEKLNEIRLLADRSDRFERDKAMTK